MKDNYEPGLGNSDVEPVASHSCTSGKSIEQTIENRCVEFAEYLIDNGIFDFISFTGVRQYYKEFTSYYPIELPNAQVSDTTDDAQRTEP